MTTTSPPQTPSLSELLARIEAIAPTLSAHADETEEGRRLADASVSFAQVNPLQRIWRDSSTAGRHAVADPLVNQEVYGKALLGIPYEENITPLI